MKVVLIDDELDSLGAMQILIKKYCPKFEIIAAFSNSEAAFQFLDNAQNNIDLVFLDLEMPHMSGFDLLSKLKEINFKVVIVSAHDKFGIKAVKFQVYDYLLKPVDPEELKMLAQKLESNQLEHEITRIQVDDENKIISDKLLLPIGNGYDFVEIDNIIRVESDDNYATIFTIDRQNLLLSKTLKYVENLLKDKTFIRVHNSHLINIKHIKKYIKSDGGYFEMIDNVNVPLSRTKREEVLNYLGLRTD